MLFQTPRGTFYNEFTIRYSNLDLERVSEIRFLGLIVNDKLDWSPHISRVSRKLVSITGVLYNLWNYIPQDLNLKKSIYFSLVKSYINYGITVWGSGGDKARLQPIYVSQKNVSDLSLKSLELVNKLRVTLRVPLMNIAF